MRTRWILAVGLALALVSAGCLGGAQETLDPSANGTDDPEAGGNETSSPDQSRSDAENGTDEQESSDPGTDKNQTDDTSAEEPSKSASHPPWPEVSEASVRPGVRISSSSGQCTSNFLFRTPDNASLMLGLAAHCVSENPRAGNGCDAAVEPMEPGTEVTVSGAARPGTLVYSSWWTMQQTNETSRDACWYNDFALIELHPADRASVHPALMHYGGPTGLAAPGDVQTGEKLLWYGNSGIRQNVEDLKRNEGYALRQQGGWSLVMYSVTPGVPGDSGSAVVEAGGQAAGVLSTIRYSPEPGSNGVPMLAPLLSYAAENGVEAELVTWPQFEQGQLP